MKNHGGQPHEWELNQVAGSPAVAEPCAIEAAIESSRDAYTAEQREGMETDYRASFSRWCRSSEKGAGVLQKSRC
jgi:hypothetical protein